MLACFDGEMAGDLAGAAGDRPQNARRRDDLAVEHDGEGPPDVLGGDLAEALAAADVEAEIDDRLLRALVEAGLGVGQILALHHHLLLDRQLDAGLVDLVERLDRRGVFAGLGDEAEFELRRGAENVLQLAGVLQARHLDQDAVVALALDVRLGGAEGVDAAAQDLDRLLDRVADLGLDAGVGRGELDEAVGAGRDIEGGRAGAAEATASPAPTGLASCRSFGSARSSRRDRGCGTARRAA